MNKTKHGGSKAFLLRVLGLSALMVGLGAASYAIQYRTSFFNKASFNCSSIVVRNIPYDWNRCESQLGCRIDTRYCEWLSSSTCLQHNGCSQVPAPTDELSCKFLTETDCANEGCKANYACEPIAPRHRAECLGLQGQDCRSRRNKCRWEYTGCQANPSNMECQGNYYLCVSNPVVCQPGATECTSGTQMKTCRQNGGNWIISNCPSGKTCQPASAYSPAGCR